ncbi:MAG: MopE-related protein, partial [Myxococcota bacterium]|nr:MopE-related protein [Myxococcota bacterium]
MPLTWFLLLGILACGGRDRDGDGYEEAHGDCDDSDASVHPGADEFCDGIDTDCDGTLDGSDALDPTVWYLDLDGDGYGDEGDVGEKACDAPAGRVSDNTDCEDQDSSIHPDAEDLCDEVDTDCDGAVDDDEAQDWYLDADQDGWGDSDQSASACDPPALYVDQGGDCDDERSSVNPDAEEVWYDGRDEDCDGEDDFDADADGYASGVHGGEDCQDALDEVNPSATEICGDGLDNDCDGTGNSCSPFGVRTLDDMGSRFLSSYLVSEGGIELGSSVAGNGDLNGDGLMDVVVGGMGPSTAAGTPGAYVAPEDGYVLVFYGPVTGEELTEADSDADLTDLRCGIWLAMAGDVDADGFDDLAVGCKQGGAGHLYLLSGPIEGTVAIEDEFTASMEGAASTVTVIVEAAGDVDGDGFADLLASAPLESTGGTDAGAVYLLQGPVTGEFTLETEQVQVKLNGVEGQQLEMVGGEGDVDGDGLGDFLAAGAEAESRGPGRVYLVAGSDLSVPGEFSLEDVARAELV